MENLYWPTINATKSILAAKLREMGYITTHYGRSCFEARNCYEISIKDGELNVENIEKIKKDIIEAEKQTEIDKKHNFDEYFDNESDDVNKVYAFVMTGYNYHQTRIADDKYYTAACMRTACTADHRNSEDHTYLSFVINEERIKNDKRAVIVLYVPKDMMGLVIGKGGSNIKALSEKYGKRFIIKNEQQKKAKILENRKKYEKQQKEPDTKNSSSDFLSSVLNIKKER